MVVGACMSAADLNNCARASECDKTDNEELAHRLGYLNRTKKCKRSGGSAGTEVLE